MSEEENKIKHIQVGIKKSLAEKAQNIFKEVGLTQTEALNIFYKKVVKENEIPFDIEKTKRQKVTEKLVKSAKKLPSHTFKNTQEVKEWINNNEENKD